MNQFTLSYENGIVNVEDEIFELAKNLNLVERPNNRTYIFNEQKYNSKKEFIEAIKEDNNMRNQLLNLVYSGDTE